MRQIKFSYYHLSVDYSGNININHPTSRKLFLVHVPDFDVRDKSPSEENGNLLAESARFIKSVFLVIKDSCIGITSFNFTKIDDVEAIMNLSKFYRVNDGTFDDFINNRNLSLFNLDFETVYFRNSENKTPININTHGYIGFNLNESYKYNYNDFSNKLKSNKTNQDLIAEMIFDDNVVI